MESTIDFDRLSPPMSPTLRLIVVRSSMVPGALSLRAEIGDGLKHELAAAGFKEGDTIELVLVRRGPPREEG